MIGEPTATEFAALSQQKALAGFLPYLDAEIARQKLVIEAHAMAALRTGDLTGDLAASLWTQWAALTSIRKGFETRVRIGTAVGERLNDVLTAGRQGI